VPAVHALSVLDALGLHFATFFIDDDQMEADRFQQVRELLHSCTLRTVFGLGDDAVRHPGTHREFALAQVGDGARSPKIAICGKVTHEVSVAVWRSPLASSESLGTCRIGLVDSRQITFAAALLCSRSGTELSCSCSGPELSCSCSGTELSCSCSGTELSCSRSGTELSCSCSETEQSNAGRVPGAEE
jgi:hypothetical protein